MVGPFLTLFFAAFIFMMSSGFAYACTNPSGVEGEIIYNSANFVPTYCDGTDWIGMAGGDVNNVSCPAGIASCGGRSDERVVFVTSTTTTGNTGGISGANAICQARANAGGLVGRYAAWLSDGNAANSPSQRFEQSSVPYTRLDGTIVANNWADLADGTLSVSLNMTELGTFVTGPAYANTNANGTIRHSTDTCSNFTVAAGITFGDNVQDTNWSSTTSLACNTGRYLYCFEQPSITQIVPSGLIGHWRLDETSGTTALDSSGNGRNGTITGTTAASATQNGIIGKALYFDDTDNQVNIGNLAALNLGTSDMSYSVWVKPERDGVIMGKRVNAVGGDGYELRFDLPQLKFQAMLGGAAGSTYIRNSAMTAVVGKWYHVAVTMDRDGLMSLYVDGVLDNTLSISAENATNITNTEVFNIGGNNSGGNTFFGGVADDARLYNRVLSAAEILAIYQARDGIRYNSNQKTMEYFDGNKFVSMTPAWAEVNQASAPACQTIGETCPDGTIYAGNSPDGNIPMFTTSANAPGGATYSWNNGNATGYVQVMPDPCYSSGEAGCITGALNTTTGAAADSDSVTGGVQPHQAIAYCDALSSNTHSDWYLPAQEELEVLFNNRTVGSLNGTFGVEHWTSSEVNNSAANFFDFSGSGANNSSKQNTMSVRCVRKGALPTGSVTAGLVGHWKLDETSGTTAVDSSGYGNNGTMTGLSASSNGINGAVGRALEFDPSVSNSSISIPNNAAMAFGGKISYSFWFKRNPYVTNINMFLTSGPGNSEIEILSGNLHFKRGGGSNSANIAFSPQFNRWYHLVATFDDNTDVVNYYLDGAFMGTRATADTFNTSGGLTIGRSITTRTGAIDDVRVYNRILSAAEASILYAMGSPTGAVTALPQGCPNVGDVCDDGTVFVDNSPDGNIPMYAAPVDEPGNYMWGSFGTQRSTGSNTDGDGNTTILAAFGAAAHPPAYQCASKVFGGADDWYLPARDELSTISQGGNPTAPNIAGSGTRYWSSSETDSNSGRYVTVSTGGSGNMGKNGNVPIRCVRKGPAPRCANPYGLAGTMLYNQDHSTVQYCDGARWIAIGRGE